MRCIDLAVPSSSSRHAECSRCSCSTSLTIVAPRSSSRSEKQTRAAHAMLPPENRDKLIREAPVSLIDRAWRLVSCSPVEKGQLMSERWNEAGRTPRTVAGVVAAHSRRDRGCGDGKSPRQGEKRADAGRRTGAGRCAGWSPSRRTRAPVLERKPALGLEAKVKNMPLLETCLLAAKAGR